MYSSNLKAEANLQQDSLMNKAIEIFFSFRKQKQ